jgi:hypothetical protein
LSNKTAHSEKERKEAEKQESSTTEKGETKTL